jgi:hypothetical protein
MIFNDGADQLITNSCDQRLGGVGIGTIIPNGVCLLVHQGGASDGTGRIEVAERSMQMICLLR